MQIKILHKQGKSLRAIAGELGCSVNTVRKYVNGETPPAYQERVRRESKVAPFATYLQQRVAAAAPDWIPATVLWRELCEKGFDGSERTVRNFVATLRPVRAPDPLLRFETAAGDQMQVDWIEFRRRKGQACSPSSPRSATAAPAMSSSCPTCGSIPCLPATPTVSPGLVACRAGRSTTT